MHISTHTDHNNNGPCPVGSCRERIYAPQRKLPKMFITENERNIAKKISPPLYGVEQGIEVV